MIKWIIMYNMNDINLLSTSINDDNIYIYMYVFCIRFE